MVIGESSTKWLIRTSPVIEPGMVRTVTPVNISLYPVSFALEDGPSRLVVLEHRELGTLAVRAGGDPRSAAMGLL